MLHTKSDKSRLVGVISPECEHCSGFGCFVCPIFWREEGNEPPPVDERIEHENTPPRIRIVSRHGSIPVVISKKIEQENTKTPTGELSNY